MIKKIHEDVAKNVSRQQQVEVAGTLNGGARCQQEVYNIIISKYFVPMLIKGKLNFCLNYCCLEGKKDILRLFV
jgi:hypothetical protein